MGRSRTRVGIGVLGALAAAGLLGLLSRQPAPAGLLATGTTEATEFRLGFPTPGRIAEVLAREGDRVESGRLLARLDTAELAARRGLALAQVDAARAALSELLAGTRAEELAQARAVAAAAEERWSDARRDRERVRQLFEGGAASREALDKAGLAAAVAESQRSQAADQLRLLELGPRPERIAAQRARLREAQAAVQVLDASLDQAELRAPASGTVTLRHREPGETVAAGAAVLTVSDLGDRWVRIYVPETRVGSLRLGMPAAIQSDSHPGRTYSGELVFIASEAEFTPKNVQTAEERVKLVYAAKVRITGDPACDLKPGVPADVRLGPER